MTDTADERTVEDRLTEARGGFTQEQLETAFSKVAPEGNWKYPIDAEIDAEDREVVERAVPWFTGGPVDFEQLPSGRLRVTGPGYYASVGP